MRAFPLVLAVAPIGVPLVAAPTASYAAQPPAERAGHVLEQRVIGTSVRGRDIRAWHLDDANGKGPTLVLVSTMHGNEPATQQILHALRKGPQIRGVDLDRKSTRLNSSHSGESRMPSSA